MISKRNSLKKIAGAGAVVALAPSPWTKPLIGSIILPAHAQTSSVVLKISTSGPVIDGNNTNEITANKAAGEPVIVEMEVEEPFSLSEARIEFEPLEVGKSETKDIDILDANRAINSTESIKVTWAESMLQVTTSGPVVEGENTTNISANSAIGDAVSVKLKVNSPFSLSVDSLEFKALKAGQSEDKTVDILNADRSVNTSESVKVSWVESKLSITTSGPVVAGRDSNDITADNAAKEPVVAELSVSAPFRLSESRLSFSPKKAGVSETKMVDLLNPDRSIAASESISVKWTEAKLGISTSGPIISGENTDKITADSLAGTDVAVKLSVATPFRLSTRSLTFKSMKAGTEDTQTVDILNEDGSLNATKSITVSWAERKK